MDLRLAPDIQPKNLQSISKLPWASERGEQARATLAATISATAAPAAQTQETARRLLDGSGASRPLRGPEHAGWCALRARQLEGVN